MNNKFDQLRQAAANAESAARRADSNLHEFLKPIIMAAFDFVPVRINGVYLVGEGRDWIEVDFSYSRGYRDSDSVEFPRSIVDAADPVAAAAQFKLDKEQREQERKRTDKLRELARRQEELTEE